MKLIRGLLGFLLVFALAFVSFLSVPPRHVVAQESNTALTRGYRTGYSDGYMSGYRDVLDNKAKDFGSHPEYSSANRAYNKAYGPIEDYRDGYQQGFEGGYAAGFDKKEFNSDPPAQIMLRGTPSAVTGATSSPATPAPTDTASATTAQTQTAATTPTEQPVPTTAQSTTPSIAEQPQATTQQTTPATTEQPATATATTTQNVSFSTDTGVITIARDTELILELQGALSTDKNKAGDKFTAKVVSPNELNGAIVEGRVSKITKPGHLKRRSELSMSFDRIVLNETRWSNFSGILTEVMPVKGDNIRRVDNEGTAVGNSSMKPDAIKVGAATGTGAVIGGVTGGPVGAGIGAGLGAAFGVGAVVIERGKDIRLNANQQLRIKTAYDTQIR